MLGGGAPVGVDRLDVLGVGLALPADQEPLGEGLALVDVALRHDRLVQPARGLGGVREHHHRDPAEVRARLLVADVVGLPEAERRRQHRDRGLHVDPDVAGVDRDVVGLGRREPGLVGAVDQQPPDLLERHPPDELLDVDAAVAQRRPFLVGLGDLGLEGDDALQAVVDLGHADSFRDPRTCRTHSAPSGSAPRLGAMSPAVDPPVDLAALREEYARGGLAESDLADDPMAMFRALVRRGRDCGAARAERDGGRDRGRRRPAVVSDRAAQGPRRARLRLLHQRALPQGRGAGGQPALLAAVPVARRSSGRSASTGRRRPCRATDVAAYFATRPRGSQLGAWASHQSRVVSGREELDRRVRGRGGALPRTTYRSPTSGAGTSWSPRRWSSGRAGPAGCTTGWSTGAAADGDAWEVVRLAP